MAMSRRFLAALRHADMKNRKEREHLMYLIVIIGLISLVVCLQIVRLHRMGFLDLGGHGMPDPLKVQGPGKADVSREVIRDRAPRHTQEVSTKSPTRPRKELGHAGNETKLPVKRDILPQRRINTRLHLSQDFIDSRVRENVHRRQTLNAHCDRHLELNEGELLSEGALQHIFVSDSINLMFCCVPQAGCTNWKGIVIALSDKETHFEDLDSAEIHRNRGLKKLASFSFEERKYIMDTFIKFVYVRDPFNRLFSAYKHLIEDTTELNKRWDMQKVAKDILQYHKKEATLEDLFAKRAKITWEEFATYISKENGHSMEEHFQEMHKLCDPCKVQYEYLGKLETVQNDSAVMLRELNYESIASYPSRDKSMTNSNYEFNEAFRSLSDEVLTDLWRLYESDFGLFDYPKPAFLT